VAGAAAAAAAGGWSLAGDGAAGGATADAAADAARSVSPPCVREWPRPRHRRGQSRTRTAHLRQRARRWRRARRPVAQRAAAARPRASRRRLLGRCHPYPLHPRPSIPPTPLTARGAASPAVPPLSLLPSLPPWRPPAPPRCGGGGAGHGTSRVGRRAVGRPPSWPVERLLFLCGACLARAFWGCMLRGCSLRFAHSLIACLLCRPPRRRCAAGSTRRLTRARRGRSPTSSTCSCRRAR